MSKKTLTRRNFLKLTGAAAAAVAVGSTPGRQSALAFPYVRQQGDPIKFAIQPGFEESMLDFLEEQDFTGQTGIAVEVVSRPRTPDEMITQMAAGAQAENSPYDVIDFEDELAITMSRAGWIAGLDDLLPSDFWEDFPPTMINATETWCRYEGATFRIYHNYEPMYHWYRQDWFDEKGVTPPTTWDELAALGAIFTDEDAGVWAVMDGLQSGAFLNVYLAYMTLQAGGNSFDVGDEFRTALQFIYDLMYTHKTLNPASLQIEYNGLNAAYMADQVAYMRQWPYVYDVTLHNAIIGCHHQAYMRQWPYVYDVTRANTEWFSEEKLALTLPPVGPGGKENSTYAAGWGWGIPLHTQRLDEAKELLNFLVAPENAAAMAATGSGWYLSARNSVLAVVGENEGLPAALRLYSDAGVIGVRPFHENFVEALSILEESASAYLTNQISLDEAIDQAKSRLGRL
jgi:ABC-type glycerol-3-phosphate transport system substrate-binding protein